MPGRNGRGASRRPRSRRSTSRRSGLIAASVVRARCSALVTDATLVSRSSATSDALQRSTSQRIKTARCLGRRCRRAAMTASRTVSRVSATGGRICLWSDAIVGWLRPESPRERAHVVGSRLAGRTEIDRKCPALPSLEHVQADVPGDAVQPGPQRPPPLELVEAPQRTDERFLNRVFGIGRAKHPVAEARELHAVLLELLHRRAHALALRPVMPLEAGGRTDFPRCPGTSTTSRSSARPAAAGTRPRGREARRTCETSRRRRRRCSRSVVLQDRPVARLWRARTRMTFSSGVLTSSQRSSP